MSQPGRQADSETRRPPQALEAEAAVLGAMLLDPDAVPTVLQYLRPEHFYLHAHGVVCQAILSLFEQKVPVDITTVTAELRRMKEFDAVGGTPFLSGLEGTILTTAHCEEHARLVLEKAVQRQLIQAATEIVQAAYDEGRRVDELLNEAEQKIFELRESGYRRGFERIKELLMKEWERAENAMKTKQLLTGVETGFVKLDEMTSGLQAGDLVIVAGRPGMGKTALALNIAVNASTRRSTPVAIFSLEMSCQQLTQRLLCATADVSMHNLRRGLLGREERTRLFHALGILNEAPIFIDDSAALNALDMRARARRLKSQSKLGLVVVDYLQLMEAHGQRSRDRNRQQEVSDMTRALKAMAKELNVPVIVISQLSRAPETRGGEMRPRLADLRESGAIEQDADVVLLLYRPEYYNKQDESLRGKAELDIAKQRNGPLGRVELTFLSRCARFENPFVGPGAEEPPPDESGYEI
ncbi:MAG: replicative DNA helicase [candidate division WOR-3 bacterium]